MRRRKSLLMIVGGPTTALFAVVFVCVDISEFKLRCLMILRDRWIGLADNLAVGLEIPEIYLSERVVDAYLDESIRRNLRNGIFHVS